MADTQTMQQGRFRPQALTFVLSHIVPVFLRMLARRKRADFYAYGLDPTVETLAELLASVETLGYCRGKKDVYELLTEFVGLRGEGHAVRAQIPGPDQGPFDDFRERFESALVSALAPWQAQVTQLQQDAAKLNASLQNKD